MATTPPPQNLDNEPDWDAMGVDPHPLADKYTPPKWDEFGECICGEPLAPLRDWDDAGGAWAHTTCAACGRGYVDEEEFTAIYDEGLGD